MVFPVFALLQTVGFTLGTGAGSILSRSLGAKKRKQATSIASLSFILSLSCGLLILAVGLIFRENIPLWFGANAETLQPAKRYIVGMSFSAPIVCGSFVLGNLLRAEGKTAWATLGTGVGVLTTVLLEALFLFRWKLGVSGAAIAFPVGYAAAFLSMLPLYLFGKSAVRLSFREGICAVRQTGALLRIGLPSLFRQGFGALAAMLLNHAANGYGTSTVAALSVSNRIFLLLYALVLGTGQGILPIAGVHFGAGDAKRTVKIFRATVFISCVLLLSAAVPVFWFAPRIVALFRNDAELLRTGSVLLRLSCATLVLHGLIANVNLLLQTVGKAVSASLLAAARQGLFFLPVLLFLPRWFGETGLLWAQTVADLLTFLLALPFFFHLLHLAKTQKERLPKDAL